MAQSSSRKKKNGKLHSRTKGSKIGEPNTKRVDTKEESKTIDAGKQLLEQTNKDWFQRVSRYATSIPRNMNRMRDGDFDEFLDFYGELLVRREKLEEFCPGYLTEISNRVQPIRKAVRADKRKNAASASRLETLERQFNAQDDRLWVPVVPGGLCQGN